MATYALPCVEISKPVRLVMSTPVEPMVTRPPALGGSCLTSVSRTASRLKSVVVVVPAKLLV